MLWFWIDLFFPFFSIHVLLTVDLYIPRRRSMRDVRMIIILSRPTKLRPDSAWAVACHMLSPWQIPHKRFGDSLRSKCMAH